MNFYIFFFKEILGSFIEIITRVFDLIVVSTPDDDYFIIINSEYEVEREAMYGMVFYLSFNTPLFECTQLIYFNCHFDAFRYGLRIYSHFKVIIGCPSTF